ncbi:MAG: rRNA biogenesis protein rrp5 [Bacillaceae bacterium]|nr:rRNA biogenesis protein rrp5 [Bacillaceae bacterium]
MSKIKRAMDVVTDLQNLAASIEYLVEALKSGEAEEVSSKEIPEKKPPSKVKQPTLEEVKTKLSALSLDGKQVQVKALITGLGAKKLSEVPVEKYAELLKKAEELL